LNAKNMPEDVQAARFAKAGLLPPAELQHEAARLMQAVNTDVEAAHTGTLNSGAVESGATGNQLPDLLVETTQTMPAHDTTQQTEPNTVQSPQNGGSEGLAELEELEGSEELCGSEQLGGSEGPEEPNRDTAHPDTPEVRIGPEVALPPAQVAGRMDTPAADVRDESAPALESTQLQVGS
jgi:hypothetical protein